jgi:L-lysine 2,3-aminomutase
LAGVNDCPQILLALSERLFACGVLPYYLHLLDKVQGAAHFDIPLEKALLIFRQLQRLLPGYLVPRLAREEAGEKNKTLII